MRVAMKQLRSRKSNHRISEDEMPASRPGSLLPPPRVMIGEGVLPKSTQRDQADAFDVATKIQIDSLVSVLGMF